jgi:hypothetical protein
MKALPLFSKIISPNSPASNHFYVYPSFKIFPKPVIALCLAEVFAPIY